MNATIMYGISPKSCDTIKKAQQWLHENNIAFSFHDYRKDGLDSNLLDQLYQTATWEALLNKRSSSYRALTAQQKESLDKTSVSRLFIAFPTLIKRPLLIHNGVATLGFNDKTYHTLFTV